MALKYYYDLMSQPSRAIYIFLKANKIQFEAKPVALRSGEHFGEEFTKLNPWQKVPVLNDDGFVLTESVAILNYLVRKYKLPEHWYPQSDTIQRARVEEYLHWQHVNTRLQPAMIFREKLILPMATKSQINQKQVDKLKAMVPKVIEHLDKYFLRDKPFIIGDQISVADLLGVCELTQLDPVFEEDLYKSNANVAAWVERVKETLKPHFDEGHAIVYRTKEAYKKLGPKVGAKL